MSRVLAVVAEYNPFHNGHFYHLEESKKQTSSDHTIAIMSGNFVQRGDTSLVNKWTKAEMALANGADLVVELPTIYSVSSAENFADGAVKILDSLNIVDTISFGSEIADVNILNKFATVLHEEPKEYVSLLNHELSKGISYPKARENALLMYLNDIRKYANILSSPNNILGIEYLKALKKYKSSIIPITIKREGVDYNSEEMVNGFGSATLIRKLVEANDVWSARKIMPKSSFDMLFDSIKSGNYVSSLAKFEKIIIYNLRKMPVEEIAELPDVTEGLENAISKAANSCNTIGELINIIKTKRYTQTRLQRILVYSLLGITKKDMLASKKVVPYIRVLGFNQKGEELLSAICNANPKLSIVTSVRKFMDLCPNKQLKQMMQIDINATDVYTLGYEYDSWSGLDYTKKLITM